MTVVEDGRKLWQKYDYAPIPGGQIGEARRLAPLIQQGGYMPELEVLEQSMGKLLGTLPIPTLSKLCAQAIGTNEEDQNVCLVRKFFGSNLEYFKKEMGTDIWRKRLRTHVAADAIVGAETR